MDFTKCLPLEVVEEIFSYLSDKDLLACSEVSVNWRETANSGELWHPICERLSWKYSLALCNIKSSFVDQTKQFSLPQLSERLSPVTDWKLCYLQQKYISRNWSRGHYTTHSFTEKLRSFSKLTFTSIEPSVFFPILEVVDDRYVFSVMRIDGKPMKVAQLEESMEYNIFAICVAGNTIVYIIDDKLKILKYQNDRFIVIRVYNLQPSMAELRLTDSIRYPHYDFFICMNSDYLCAGNASQHFYFHVWDCKSYDKLDFVECPVPRSRHSQFCLCGDSMYLTINQPILKRFEVHEYSVVEKKVTLFSTLPLMIMQIICNERFLIAVSVDSNKWYKVFIYERMSKTKLNHFPLPPVYDPLPVVLESDLLCCLYSSRIMVMSLPSCEMKSRFNLLGFTDRYVHCSLHMRQNLIILNRDHRIEVWDWKKELFLYEHPIEYDIVDLYLDNVRLVWTPTSGFSGAEVISFW